MNREKVEAILQRHAGMSTSEMMRSSEMTDLIDRFLAGINTPEVEEKMGRAVAEVHAAKGMESGTIMMQFDRLDDPLGRSWLEAVVSGDARKMQEWVLNRLNGAAIEFTLDPELDETSEGTKVEEASRQPRGDRSGDGGGS